MLEDKLEIFIITYNRSFFLDKTLRNLKESPFSKCKLTILDNCSTDDSPEICRKYAEAFPDYHIIRHKRNIGGDPNALRAIELSNSHYTWILCDDDNFDFSDVSDVIDAIESGSYDLIYVGSRSEVHLNYTSWGAISSRKLADSEARYYRAFTFWPVIIFRTVLFDDKCLSNGYLLISSLYPHFTFIDKSVREDFKVYISKKEVVIRFEGNSSGFSGLFWYAAWVNCCRTIIKDRKLRSKVIDQAIDRGGFFKTLAFWIAFEKTTHADNFYKRLIDIFSGLTFWQRLKFLLLLPVMIVPIPKSFLLAARRMTYRIMGIKDIPPVETDSRA